jgi:uncharacterized membrane protein
VAENGSGSAVSPEYVSAKFAHIFIAVVALGTSAGLGIMLELFGNHPTHGGFVLRAIRRLVYVVVLPGYVLMLFTGLWLAHLSWSLATGWIRNALALWCLGAVLLALSAASLHRQIGLFETAGVLSEAYRRTSLGGRLLGGATGLVVIAMLYLMVAKPGS